MEIELRNERFSDYPETENVVREAFWNRYSPGCYEHYLIHIMRYSRAFVPQLDFVAVFDDKIVGNIVFLKSVIQADTGKEYEVLSLGPISVLPEYQNMGIGKRLIDHTRNLAKCMGFRAILLCGIPTTIEKGICACRDLRNTDSRRHVCRCVACVRVI